MESNSPVNTIVTLYSVSKIWFLGPPARRARSGMSGTAWKILLGVESTKVKCNKPNTSFREEPVSGFLYPGIYYKNTVFTLWERLPAAINDGSAVLLRYSRLEAAPTRVDNPVK